MKKITLLLSFLTFSISNGQIVVKDIPDFTLSTGTFLNFDFNSDGTNEFKFENISGSVETFFDFSKVNFVGCGTLADGYGWDVMKPLPVNTTISNASSLDAQGDAYINAFWANPTDMFPIGDSYIGTRFKIGNNTHYGWILVNSTGGANGIIKVKSYAYNSTANESLKTGQTLSNKEFQNDFEFSIFPNPVKDYFTIKTEKGIESASLFTITGKKTQITISNNSANISQLESGIYFLNLKTTTNEFSTIKLVKE